MRSQNMSNNRMTAENEMQGHPWWHSIIRPDHMPHRVTQLEFKLGYQCIMP